MKRHVHPSCSGLITVLVAGLCVITAGGAAAADLGGLAPAQSASQPAERNHGHGPPLTAEVAPPKVAPPEKLPQTTETVPLNSGLRISGPAVAAPDATAAAANPNKVGVRALIVALDANDYGLPTWKSMLDRVGAAYDVIMTKDQALTNDTLVRADGAGKYNAILLTDATHLYQDASGAFVSGFSADEWNLLWAYERDYRVRQVALFASYGTFPEDYCLRAGSEGGVGDTPLNATLTTAGQNVFNDLKPTVQIPITQSYVYQDTLAAGCNAQSVLTAGSSVLGVLSTSTDGRERMALTFSSNQYLIQAHLLTYGLFRWASRGLYFGELRHYLNTDVDDWFNSTDELLDTGVLNSDPGFQMTAHDAYNARTQQNALQTRYPLANPFRFAMAFNAGSADMNAGTNCSPNGGINQLTATSRCIRNDVRWINHTLNHPKMNFTDYPTSFSEIKDNLTLAQRLGLPTPATVLKTGEYSGLGVYHPDVNNDVDPPTDFGLQAANPDLLQAAYDVGVRYLHGNMSFVSHQPACFNCGKPFPRPTDNPPGPPIPENVRAALLIVPDWPTNIAYFSTTPSQETYFYNSYYGPNGKFPYWPTDQTYPQILEHESAQALSHIATGSIYTHTLHIGNLRDYGNGKTLATDWLDQTMAKYTALYNVPLLSPDWLALATYTKDRIGHFAELGAGVDAVYDRVANTVTVTSPVAGKVTVSGARTAGFTTYGTEVSAPITLAAGTPVTFTPSLRP
jgi:hypothetical protein